MLSATKSGCMGLLVRTDSLNHYMKGVFLLFVKYVSYLIFKVVARILAKHFESCALFCQ
jgi:hypothetical protein